MASLQLLDQRIAVLYKSLAILILNIIVLFVCLDFAARVADKAHLTFPQTGTSSRRPAGKPPFLPV